jgi:hypothetical protein
MPTHVAEVHEALRIGAIRSLRPIFGTDHHSALGAGDRPCWWP